MNNTSTSVRYRKSLETDVVVRADIDNRSIILYIKNFDTDLPIKEVSINKIVTYLVVQNDYVNTDSSFDDLILSLKLNVIAVTVYHGKGNLVVQYAPQSFKYLGIMYRYFNCSKVLKIPKPFQNYHNLENDVCVLIFAEENEWSLYGDISSMDWELSLYNLIDSKIIYDDIHILNSVLPSKPPCMIIAIRNTKVSVGRIRRIEERLHTDH